MYIVKKTVGSEGERARGCLHVIIHMCTYIQHMCKYICLKPFAIFIVIFFLFCSIGVMLLFLALSLDNERPVFTLISFLLGIFSLAHDHCEVLFPVNTYVYPDVSCL